MGVDFVTQIPNEDRPNEVIQVEAAAGEAETEAGTKADWVTRQIEGKAAIAR